MGKHHSDRFVTLVDDAKTRIEEVTPAEVKKKFDTDDDFVLLDIREQDEWEDARISGAEYLGRGVIERDIEEAYPDVDEEIILYCGGGYRSALAADNLQKMGYHNVKSMAGGFGSWTEAGYPIEKKDS
ncbi:rhodanese-like domain-containing protein [Fodinibius sediminis]|uniref:Rhodanese-related sulfurtransferase n=1 Tax=Fodinibius sediminis TaxID=1214077 RepID=A0A521AL58_9BACT|nr:rhodanese-like domain-containing protein [Fodinibius sediminis]SMO35546.1 Rhodanese-related sulfurtransferase [Fodinibius sediminis]